MSILYHDLEIKLSKDIIDLLQIYVNPKNHVLYKDFLPIIVNRKILKPLTNNDFINFSNEAYFRPIKIGKHCQFLIDYFYENYSDDNIKELITIKNDNGTFSAKIIDNDSNVVKFINGTNNEIETKFIILYEYIFDTDIKNDIKIISEFNAHQDFIKKENSTRR